MNQQWRGAGGMQSAASFPNKVQSAAPAAWRFSSILATPDDPSQHLKLLLVGLWSDQWRILTPTNTSRGMPLAGMQMLKIHGTVTQD